MKSYGLSLVFLFAAVAGCDSQNPNNKVAQVQSPNGSLEAILTETNGGATTSFGYEVAIEATGARNPAQIAILYGAVRSEDAYGVDLSWENDHTLLVRYLRARAIQKLSNTLQINGQQVEIRLQSGINDPVAPPGGMYYNLSKHNHR